MLLRRNKNHDMASEGSPEVAPKGIPRWLRRMTYHYITLGKISTQVFCLATRIVVGICFKKEENFYSTLLKVYSRFTQALLKVYSTFLVAFFVDSVLLKVTLKRDQLYFRNDSMDHF